MGLLQRGRTRLDGEAARHFRHRREQRQAAAISGYGFIGYRGDAAGDQPLGLLRIGSEMQVGVEDLPLAQLHPFARLRLLDLDDHVGLFKHIAGRCGDPGAGGDIGAVVRADARARARLDQHLMAVRHIFAHRAWRQADAIFVILDFLRAADAHLCSSRAGFTPVIYQGAN